MAGYCSFLKPRVLSPAWSYWQNLILCGRGTEVPVFLLAVSQGPLSDPRGSHGSWSRSPLTTWGLTCSRPAGVFLTTVCYDGFLYNITQSEEELLGRSMSLNPHTLKGRGICLGIAYWELPWGVCCSPSSSLQRFIASHTQIHSFHTKGFKSHPIISSLWIVPSTSSAELDFLAPVLLSYFTHAAVTR